MKIPFPKHAISLALALSSGIAATGAALAQGSAALEEVIVTAQHRAETLQSTALALSAVTGDTLTNAGVADTFNLSRLVPSLVAQPSGGSGVNFYLRGVGTLQGNVYGENPVGYYFNGVYISRPSAPVGSFYDIERVEVLKGPQGTLYGRNATGGAVSVIPKAPQTGELSGTVTAEFGNYALRRGQGALNVPIGEASAIRLAAQVSRRDGFMSDGYDDEDGLAGRLALLTQPTDALAITVTADYFKEQSKGVGSVLLPSSLTPDAPSIDNRIGGSDPRSIAALMGANPGFAGLHASGMIVPPKDDGFIDSEYFGLSARVEWEVSGGSFTVIPAWRLSKPEFRMYTPGFLGEQQEKAEQYSVEARFASDFEGPLNFVAGLYWFDETNEGENFFYQGSLSGTYFTPDLDTESYAVFGQATYELTDTFRLVAGVRYTEESREQSTEQATLSPGVTTINPSAPVLGSLDFEEVTWKLGIEWDLSYDSLLYANVATGFKAGGFFTNEPPNNTFEPEELTAFTIGSKNTFLNNRLRLNLEAFYWDYQDQQISFVSGIAAPGGGFGQGLVTINAGNSTIKGAEVELQIAVTANTMVGANVQYLDGEYDELKFTALSPGGAPLRYDCTLSSLRPALPNTPNPAAYQDVDCSGKPTLNSPELTANLMVEHTFRLGVFELVAGLRSRIESSRWTQSSYVPEQKQDSYTTTDLYLTLLPQDERWSLTGYVNNVEDETVLAGSYVRPILDVSYGALRPPRTYGARFTYHF